MVDAAPIAYAQESGLFAKYGLRIELMREPGWATIRDKIAYGELEAAHAPVGLAFALNWGLGVLRRPCLTAYLLNSNGDAITVSKELRDSGASDAPTLAAAIQGSRRSRPFTFAVPHRFSTHHFLLRHWLRPVGILPDRDVRIVVLPPSLMASCIASGEIDGYCVGEPFNSLAVREGTGSIVAESADILPLHPEKALIVSDDFHTEESETHFALIRAISEASVYCESREGRVAAATILSQPQYLGLDAALIRSSLLADGEHPEGISNASFHVFHHPEVNRPDREKANWLVAQMRLAGLLERVDLRSGPPPHHILRDDLFEAAFQTSIPPQSQRSKDTAATR